MLGRRLAVVCLALGLLGLLAACGADPLKPTPVPADLLAQALADTKSLTRYHFSMVTVIDGQERKVVRIVGDAIAPDQVYAAMSAPPTLTPYEFMDIGDTYYMKQDGVWVTPEPIPTPPPASESGSLPATGLLVVPHSPGNWPTSMILDVLPTAAQLTDAGIQTLNVADDPAATPVPVTVRHFTFSLDPATQQRQVRSVADFAVDGAVDIEPVTGHLYRFTMAVDLARQQREIFATMEASLGGSRRGTPDPAAPPATPIPGIPTKETWTYTLTRHNDPAITIPTP